MKLAIAIAGLLAGALLAQAGKDAGSKDKDKPELTASGVLDKVQEIYEKAEDYQASFEQVYKNKLLGEEKKSKGKVYIKVPGQMRWEYEEPNEKLFVSDGKTLWIWEAEANQVMKQDLSESDLPTAISFLMGKGNLNEDFDSKIVPNEKASKKGLVVIELVPKKPSTQFKKLLFMIDGATYAVKRTIIIDHSGNTNSMRFDKAKMNQGIKSKLFKFKIPKGATLVTP